MEAIDLSVKTLIEIADSNETDIVTLIKNVEKLKREYEILPAKPKLSAVHTAEQFKNFPTKLKEYEVSCEAKRTGNNRVRERNNSIDTLLESFIIEVTGFETIVPEIYKENVLSSAKLRAKNDGNVAMFVYLDEIVGIFDVK